MRIETGGAGEAAEIEAVAASGIQNYIAPGSGQHLRNSLQQGLGDAKIVQSTAGAYCCLAVAGLPGSTILGLQQIDVSAARDVERMAARADHPPVFAHETQLTVVNGTKQH